MGVIWVAMTPCDSGVAQWVVIHSEVIFIHNQW